MYSYIAYHKPDTNIDDICAVIDHLVGHFSLTWGQRARGNIQGTILPAQYPVLAWIVNMTNGVSRVYPESGNDVYHLIRWLILPVSAILRAVLLGPNEGDEGTWQSMWCSYTSLTRRSLTLRLSAV